jgi:hypothetical protein
LSSLGLSELTFVHAEHQKGEGAHPARRIALERISDIASRSGGLEKADHGVLEIN